MSERDIFLRPASNYYTYQYAYVKDSDNLYYDYNENAKVIIRTIILAIVCYQIFYEKDKIVWYECIGYILAWFFLNLRPFLVLRSFLIFLLYVGYFLVIYVWSLPVRFISLTIRFLNQITNNKAFASIGLLLALLGLVGEIYQVVTLHFGK
jgi:hypothetical protein